MQSQLFNSLNPSNLHANQYLNIQQRVQSPIDPALNLMKQQSFPHFPSNTNNQASSRANNNHKMLNSNTNNNSGLSNEMLNGPSGVNGIGNGSSVNGLQLFSGLEDINSSTSIAQSFNLAKMITPNNIHNHHQSNQAELNGLSNLKEISIGASQNGNLTKQNGYKSSGSPHSPPIVI